MSKYKLDLSTGTLKVSSYQGFKNCPLYLFLNLNAENTNTEIINVFLGTKGVPTYYRLSEDKDFANCNWNKWECNYVDFKLSSLKGNKVIYGQIKNDLYTSDAATETITLI